ncbi:MAG: hypothetical protein VYE73_13595 [Acidobacteriota bacterium]|nr:hypothetical protein [Acidobacteriota bacterium]
MASVKATIDSVTDWVRTVTDFGLGLIVALVVVDVLFPESSAITENIGAIAGQFGDNGLAGLIALLLFLLLFKNKQ